MTNERDPYADARTTAGVQAARIGPQDFTLVLRYDDVKRVARDWEHFTSATPFRVPIPEESDVRPVRQYPIETDPPEHGRYRELIEPRFGREAAEVVRPLISDEVERLVAGARSSGTLEVLAGLALPVVSLGIAATLGRPEDAARLCSWGMHVFRDPATGERRRNDDLDAYLAGYADDALADPGDDLFGDLVRARIDGRALTRDEILGYGYLVLAGGRDTVISAVAGALWHLGTDANAQALLRAEPLLLTTAVEEYLRYFSPLAHIGRTVARPVAVAGHPFARGELVSLCFASANHDADVFDEPGRCRLDRRPNRHVAFGHGPHTCIGAPLARMEIATVLERFLALVPGFRVVEPSLWGTPSASTGTISHPQDRLVLALS